MPEAVPKKLGVIFLINYYVYTNKKAGEILNKYIENINTGFFNLSAYNYDETVKYCFIKSTRELDKDGKIVGGSDPGTKVYIPQYNEGMYKINESTPEISFGNINLGNYDVLSTVLIMVKKILDVDEYVIVTYSHGSPFGTGNGFIDDTSKGANTPIIPFPDNIIADFKIKNHFFSFSKHYLSGISNFTLVEKSSDKSINADKEDEKPEEEKDEIADIIETFKPDMLTNAEQHVAFARAFGKISNSGSGNIATVPEKEIKLIINCACYVQNIDTLFALSQVTDYIVAASSSIPELSFNFPEIINKYIANQKFREYKTIAKNIVTKYLYLETLKPLQSELTEPKIKEAFEKQDNFIVLSAIDCSKLGSFFIEFNKFTLQLIDQISDEKLFDKLDIAKDNIKPFEMERIKRFTSEKEKISDPPFYMYDVKIFIDSLIKTNADFTEKTKRLLECLKEEEVVIAKHVSPLLAEKSKINEEDWSGISFYFPDEIEESKSLIGLSKFYSVFSDLQSFFSKKGYLQEFIFLFGKRKQILHDERKNKKAEI